MCLPTTPPHPTKQQPHQITDFTHQGSEGAAKLAKLATHMSALCAPPPPPLHGVGACCGVVRTGAGGGVVRGAVPYAVKVHRITVVVEHALAWEWHG